MGIKNRKIETKTDREWLLHRPQNIIGAIQEVKQTGFLLHNEKFVYTDYRIVPAFLKIVNEILDNSIDVYLKSNKNTKIDITMTDDTIKVKDNGYGIPVEKINSKLSGESWAPLIAWGEPRAGSNFNDDDNQGQMGMNGVGSYATVVFSKEFKGTTCDGKNKFEVIFKNNLEKVEYKEPYKCKTSGTTVEFKPDLKRFGMSKITDIYKNLIKQRLYAISFSYPDIKFTFNKEIIKTDTKSFISKFSEDAIVFDNPNYVVAVMPNSSDDFNFFAYTNGLANTVHGTQIDYFLDKIIPPLRNKLLRKYKGIKPGDIKNKITLVVFFRNFKRAKFNGQSKEQFTSTSGKITEHIGKIDFELWANKIYQNKKIIDPIIEIYRIKEEFEKRKALKGLEKPKKRIDSKKYYRANKKRKYLMICEGECLEEQTRILDRNFKEIKIKDVDIGDEIISSNGDKVKIISKTKLLKDCVEIKTRTNNLIISLRHRMLVYDTLVDKIIYVNGENILLEPTRYKLIKSKLNSDIQMLTFESLIEIEQDSYEINTREDKIIFATSDDDFMIFRNEKLLKINTKLLQSGDKFIFYPE